MIGTVRRNTTGLHRQAWTTEGVDFTKFRTTMLSLFGNMIGIIRRNTTGLHRQAKDIRGYGVYKFRTHLRQIVLNRASLATDWILLFERSPSWA